MDEDQRRPRGRRMPHASAARASATCAQGEGCPPWSPRRSWFREQNAGSCSPAAPRGGARSSRAAGPHRGLAHLEDVAELVTTRNLGLAGPPSPNHGACHDPTSARGPRGWRRVVMADAARLSEAARELVDHARNSRAKLTGVPRTRRFSKSVDSAPGGRAFRSVGRGSQAGQPGQFARRGPAQAFVPAMLPRRTARSSRQS
jgi:hypothetical protein